jgi:inositol-phosphate phosphatase / L-galactose 1-phosphate phosphatase / histidinol-phosphatase
MDCGGCCNAVTKSKTMLPNLGPLSAFACHLADIARSMLMEAASRQPEVAVKSDRSFVTEMDKKIEQRLRLEIKAHYPDYGIIGEEEGPERPDASVQWILDPIDGTAPFIAGVPVYGTLVALAVDQIPVIGVMDLPAANNRWVGVSGQPTIHNGTRCQTRPSSTLDKAIMACMNPDFFSDEERKALEALKAKTNWRIYGTSSMGYGLMASGRIDVALDTRLQIYDFACYRPIIEGAGGVVSDWKGEPLTLASGPRVLAAASRELHQQALNTVAD